MLKYCNNMETFRAFVFLLCNKHFEYSGKKEVPPVAVTFRETHQGYFTFYE